MKVLTVAHDEMVVDPINAVHGRQQRLKGTEGEAVLLHPQLPQHLPPLDPAYLRNLETHINLKIPKEPTEHSSTT